MAYYLRVFCASRESATISDIVESAAADGVSLRPEGGGASTDPLSAVALVYAADRPPLVLELERDAEAVEEEADELVEAVADVGPSAAAERVLARLRATKMIAAIQIPSSVADDATYDAAGSLVRYFAENRNGLIQADGEGFYEGTELILPVDVPDIANPS